MSACRHHKSTAKSVNNVHLPKSLPLGGDLVLPFWRKFFFNYVQPYSIMKYQWETQHILNILDYLPYVIPVLPFAGLFGGAMWRPLGASSGFFFGVGISSTALASLDSGGQCLYDSWPALAISY